jgi:hypothetical protein
LLYKLETNEENALPAASLRTFEISAKSTNSFKTTPKFL